MKPLRPPARRLAAVLAACSSPSPPRAGARRCARRDGVCGKPAPSPAGWEGMPARCARAPNHGTRFPRRQQDRAARRRPGRQRSRPASCWETARAGSAARAGGQQAAYGHSAVNHGRAAESRQMELRDQGFISSKPELQRRGPRSRPHRPNWIAEHAPGSVQGNRGLCLAADADAGA